MIFLATNFLTLKKKKGEKNNKENGTEKKKLTCEKSLVSVKRNLGHTKYCRISEVVVYTVIFNVCLQQRVFTDEQKLTFVVSKK